MQPNYIVRLQAMHLPEELEVRTEVTPVGDRDLEVARHRCGVADIQICNDVAHVRVCQRGGVVPDEKRVKARDHIDPRLVA